jgi:hypothetical protein
MYRKTGLVPRAGKWLSACLSLTADAQACARQADREFGELAEGTVDLYEAGQSFSELPGDRHGVSANASKTKPAKLLAVFVVDTNETELTIPFGN